MLDLLEPKQGVLNQLSQEYTIDFFCGFSSENGQGGSCLDTALVTRLSRLGIPLVFDLYPPGPIETEVG